MFTCLLHLAFFAEFRLSFTLCLRSCVSGAGKAKPQLVLLDHGLYRSLDKELRSNYAALWKVRASGLCVRGMMQLGFCFLRKLRGEGKSQRASLCF